MRKSSPQNFTGHKVAGYSSAQRCLRGDSILRKCFFVQLILSLGLICVVPGRAQALNDPPHLQLERIQLDPGAVGSLVVGSARTLPEHEMRVGLGLGYERNPSVVYVNGQRLGALVRDRTLLEAFGAFAVTSKLQLDFEMPFILSQKGEDLSASGFANPTTAGVSAPRISARYGILEQTQNKLFDLAIELGLGIPIGSKAALGTDGSFSVLPGVMADKRFGQFLIAGHAFGVFHRQDAVASQSLGDQLGVAAALVWEDFFLKPELIARTIIPLGSGGFSPGYELKLGARHTVVSHFDIFAVTGPGFGRLVGFPSYRFFEGLAFH